MYHHAPTILLCVVLMWLVSNWREGVHGAKMYESMLTMSDNWNAKWNATINERGERDHDLIKRLLADVEQLRSEKDKLFAELAEERRENEVVVQDLVERVQRSRGENDELVKELYEARKALWTEKNGPLSDDGMFF